MLNADNVYIVAMLVNTLGGNIVNADMAKLTANEPAAISSPGGNTPPERTEVYTIDGRRVAGGGLAPGIYIKRTVKGGKATTRKIMVK